MMKTLLLTIAFSLTTLTVFGQKVTEDQNKDTATESRQTADQIVRPEKMRSLRAFVETHFAKKVDKDTILETIADGKPAITFSFTDGGLTTDSILIDNGNSLELHSDTYPTAWKLAEIDQYSDGWEGPPLIDIPMTKEDESQNLAAVAVPTCAGIASPGNPYPCCTVGSNTKLGNCTFYAWHAAKTFWGYSMPTWGTNGASNAGKWYDNARDISRLPTSSTPALYSIAVSSTLSGSGHVAWPMEISNDMLFVYEQGCGLTNLGVIQKWRSAATFNKGYILSPTSAPKPTVTLATVGPILKSNSTQAIKFRVSNVNLGKRAVVIFPNGGRATLKDGQLSSVSSGLLTAYMTLSTRGTYKIQLFNENGKFSDLASFFVN
jgi:surface antigen